MSKNSTEKKAADNEHIIYKKPILLLKDRHAEAGLSEETEDFSFSAKTNSVPLNLAEFAEACKFYPIAFSEGENIFPVCILGVKNNHNLFVKDGKWKKDTYIPAYVRRYPFALNEAGNGQFSLCIDEGSTRYSEKAKKKDMRFFEENGEQSQLTKNALEFCRQFQIDHLRTQEFCKVLKEKNLIVSRQLVIQTPGADKPHTLSGFQSINEEEFAKLPVETLQQWHKSGMLFLIYQCLLSNSNWSRIAFANNSTKAA